MVKFFKKPHYIYNINIKICTFVVVFEDYVLNAEF